MTQRTMQAILDDMVSSTHDGTDICESWQQGRAVFGGLAAALGLTAILREGMNNKPLRSLLVNFVAPLPAGRATARATVLRSGKSVTQAVADVLADGQISTHMSAAFGHARPGVEVPAASPDGPLPARNSVPPLETGHGLLPAFLSHFDIHWTGGGIPMSATRDRSLSMWVRHRHDMKRHPAARLVAIADVPPPIVMSHYNRMIMGSSLSWSLEFTRPPEEVSSDWFYLDFALEAAANGYTQQSGRIFDEEGRLCMLTRQTMVYFE